MKKIFYISLITVIFSSIFISCSKDIELMNNSLVPEVSGVHECLLKLNCELNGFEDQNKTRSGSDTTEWADGSVLYVYFMNDDSSSVKAKATYNKKVNEWVIAYNGKVKEAANGNCRIVYIDNPISVEDSIVMLDYESILYLDNKANYAFNGTEISLNTILIPATGRIKFMSTDSLDAISCYGIKFYSDFDFSTGRLETEATDIYLRTRERNGRGNEFFTIYIYGDFADTLNSKLIIHNNLGNFHRTFKKTLHPTKSVFVKLPSNDSYNGWTTYIGKNVFNFVDLGLKSGTLWAYSNVSSKSKNGLETSNTSIGSCFWFGSITEDSRSSYTSENIRRNKKYDVATYYCGNIFYTPTDTQWEELWDCCSREWVGESWNGSNELHGCYFKGNSNNIFIRGMRWNGGYIYDTENGGYYWTSTGFNKYFGLTDHHSKFAGQTNSSWKMSVRAVTEYR